MSNQSFKKSKKYVQDSFADKYGKKIFDHFERTVKWLKILKPNADEAMQIAAYAHDLGRAFTPGIAYQPKKNIAFNDKAYLRKHQLAGAKPIRDFLLKIGFDQQDIKRVFNMVNKHEVGGDPESNLIKDADSLSYLEKIPTVHLSMPDKNKLRNKIEWTYNRITNKKAERIARPMYEKVIKKLEDRINQELLEKVKKFINDSFTKVGFAIIIEHFERTVYWVKKLKPGADVALLIAAMAHDAERAVYGDWVKGRISKQVLQKHQNLSAKVIGDFLKQEGANNQLIQRVKMLVSHHEDGGNQDQNLLKEADCISFLENQVSKVINIWGAKGKPINEIKQKFDYTFNKITSPKAKQIAKPLYLKAMKKLSQTQEEEYKKIKQTLIKVTQQAGDELIKRFRKIKHGQTQRKSKHEIVTPADRASNRIILKEIKQNFPSHGIISEESKDENLDAEFVWCIDPLDGTTNFTIGSPLFAVSVAVFENKKLLMSAIYLPYLKEFYFAQKSKGASFYPASAECLEALASNPLGNLKVANPRLKPGRKLKVSKENRLPHSMCTYCMGHDEKVFPKMEKIESKMRKFARSAKLLGAAALELAWVASGRTESMVIPAALLWDIAAGILLIREAGGKVTDFKGKEWNMGSKDMLATNGRVHGKVLKLIN